MRFITPYHRIFISLSLWFVTSFGHTTSLSVYTEPASIAPGEPFNLILELDENAPAGLPDFSALQYDFEIHGTSHQASYTYINGQSKSSTRWVLTLVPKHAGKITIPAIQVGQARSEPITLNIGQHATSQTTASSPKPPDEALFIKTKLSTKRPFLNQQVLYTVKIFHYSSILDAAYQPPSLGDALIVPLESNRQTQVIENGRPYLVEEQKYVFFPQKTGHQILLPPKFQALIYDDVPRRAEAQGHSATLKVQPIPLPFTADTWLPAKALSIKAHDEQPQPQLTEGSTLTRTITIKTTGLPAELLPPISLTKSTQFKSYPEHPVRNNTTVGNDVIGQTTIKVTYLLNTPGHITIPEEKISWFNTETQKKSEAILPAKHLTILPNSPHSEHVTPKVNPEPKISGIAHPKPIKSILHGLIFHLALLSAFICIGCIVFLSTRKKTPHTSSRNTQHALLKTLKKACLSHQPLAARDALLLWANVKWPNTRLLNLDDVIAHAAHAPLTKALQDLSKALYGAQKMTWNGEALWHTLQAFTRQAKKKTKKSTESNPLPPLNPN